MTAATAKPDAVDLLRRYGPAAAPAVAGVFRLRAGGRKEGHYLFRRIAAGVTDAVAAGGPDPEGKPWAGYVVVRLGSPASRPGHHVVSGPAAACSCDCVGFLSSAADPATCRHVRALNALRAAGRI